MIKVAFGYSNVVISGTETGRSRVKVTPEPVKSKGVSGSKGELDS